MNERDAILARIREGLRRPSPVPGAPHAIPLPGTAAASAPPLPPGSGRAAAHPAGNDRVGRFAQVLPAVGGSFDAMAAAFDKASQELRSEFHLLEDASAVEGQLASFRDAAGWRRVAAHHGEVVSRFASSLGLPVLWTDDGYDKRELETCDAGLTECDALIAQTGSVVVTSASAGGRALSVLPPHHVVIARRAQLVPDLPTAFRLLEQRYAGRFPSMISFVTGPSRTGDIERILVLGAHGPKRLTVLCW